MSAPPRPTDGGMEWVNLSGTGDWAHFERPGMPAIAEAHGDFETVEIQGTLFVEALGQVPTTLGVITGGGMVALLYAPTRVRPVVTGRNAIVRVYVPKGA